MAIVGVKGKLNLNDEFNNKGYLNMLKKYFVVSIHLGDSISEYCEFIANCQTTEDLFNLVKKIKKNKKDGQRYFICFEKKGLQVKVDDLLTCPIDILNFIFDVQKKRVTIPYIDDPEWIRKFLKLDYEIK